MNLPRTLGRYGYEVVAALGHGEMGSVYRARDPRLGRDVAIKLLREGYDSTELRDRFAREARSAGGLNHPNIVTIYDIGEHEGRPFIVMEYVPGETFAALIQSQAPLAVSRKLRMMEEVCAGLAHAHEAGIVHRDIKPANLMVGPDATVKILDFGIARLHPSGTTGPGVLMGTPNYKSPEQVRGGTVDRRADIFAAGAVLYELLSLHQAFPGEAHEAVVQKILSDVPVPLAEYCPDIDPRLVDIVDRALQKNADRRFQGAESLQKGLATVRRSTPDIIATRVARAGNAPAKDERARVTPSPGLPSVGMTPQPRIDRATPADPRAEEIESHLAAAGRASDAGDYDSAIESCEQVLLIDPAEPRAAAQLDRIHIAIDERQVQAWLAEARRHLSQGAIAAASDLVESAIVLSPDHPDLAPVNAEIENAKARVRTDAVRAAAVRARAACAAGDLATALISVNQALALDPAGGDARTLKLEIENAVEARKEDARIQATVDDARRQFMSHHHDAALALLEAQPASNPLVASALDELRRAQRAIEQRQRAAQELLERQQRVAALIADARLALQEQQFDDALGALDLAGLIDPAVPEVADLKQRVQREQAAVRLNAELARTLAQIDERLGADDLPGAEELLRAATALDETDARVQAARQRLEQATAERAAREAASARERESEQKAVEAADLLTRGDLAGAERLLQAAGDLNPENPRAALLATEIHEAMERRTAAEAADRVRRQAGELVRAAAQPLQAASDQPADLMHAISRVDEALALDPDNPEARNLRPALEKALASSREEAGLRAAVSNARRRFANGKHQAAIQLLESLEPSSHPLVIETLNELRAARRDLDQQQRADEARVDRQRQTVQLLSDARAALQTQQFAKALDALSQARQIDPTAATLAELTEQARAGQAAAARARESEQITAEASQCFDRGDLAGATRLLTRAVDLDPQNSSASALAARVREAAEQQAAAEAAERLLRQGEIEAALAAASQRLRSNDFDGAGELLGPILLKEPTHAGAQRLKAALDNAIVSAQKEAARRRQRIDNGLAAASKHAQRLKFPQAVDALEEVLRLEPQHERATQLLAEVRGAAERHRIAQEVDALLTRAAETDAHERAIALLQQALTLAPEDQRVVEMLSHREAALNPDLGDRALDVGTRRMRDIPVPGPSDEPKRGITNVLPNLQSVVIVGSALVVAAVILGIRFWPVQRTSPGRDQARPVAAPIEVPTLPPPPPPSPPPSPPTASQTFTLTIVGKYRFEVDYPGGKLAPSLTHSLQLPAGTTTQVRLRKSDIFLDIAKSVRGEADKPQTLSAPPLSSVIVYNGYNESCEILIDRRFVGYHPVTQELVSGRHEVSLRCATGRTPPAKRVDVPATQPGRVTFTKND